MTINYDEFSSKTNWQRWGGGILSYEITVVMLHQAFKKKRNSLEKRKE